MGDLNLPNKAVSWKRSIEGLLVPIVANHREEETENGKQDRLQAQQLIDLASKHCMLQEVEEPTHLVEVLDLVFTNNSEIVVNINVESWPAFTDHKLVVVTTSFEMSHGQPEHEEQYLSETGKRYAALAFQKADMTEVAEALSKVDWSGFENLASSDTTAALAMFNEKVLDVVEHLVPKKKKKKKSKPKMHRMRRTQWQFSGWS